MSSNMQFKKVISVKPLGKKRTLDLEVDHKDHNFYAEGMVSSNSHAVSYGALAAITAYTKFKYPQHFFTALLRMAVNEADSSEQIAKISSELPLYDIELLPPDLIRSDVDFKIEGQNIRYGLNAIKGVSEKSLGHIIDYNKGVQKVGGSDTLNKFQIFEVALQSKINIGLFSALIQAGTLDSLRNGNSRARLVLEAQAYNTLTQREKRIANLIGAEYNYDVLSLIRDAKDKGDSFIVDDNKPFMKESRLATFMKKYLPYKKIYEKNKEGVSDGFANWYYEWSLLGYSYSQKLKDILSTRDSREVTTTRDLLSLNDDEKVKMIGSICSISKKTSRNGNKYYMIEFQDDFGEVKMMWMEKNYQRYLDDGNDIPSKKSIIVVSGKKSDSIVFLDDLSCLEQKVFMKLADVK